MFTIPRGAVYIRAEFYAIAPCHAMYINARVNYFIASNVQAKMENVINNVIV